MTVLDEFKEFAVKGNVIDLAIGVIIGGGFGKIVESVVGDLVMPVIGFLIGKPDFSGLFIPLATPPAGTAITLDALRKAGVPVLAYGSFFTIVLNFLLLALVIFVMVRQINRLKARAIPPAPALTTVTDPEEVIVLREIRDSLRKNSQQSVS
jgi:large conductance mechanosensitive channel